MCLTVTHAKPLDSIMNVDIDISSLFNTKKKSTVEMVLKHNWAAQVPLGTPSSNSITKLLLKSHSTTHTVC